MARDKEIISSILEVIQNSPFGVTLEEIVKRTGHHRNTVKKYLERLKEFGFVEFRKVGYYTIVYSTAIYEFITYDYSTLFFDSLVHVLTTKYKFNREKLLEFSKDVSKIFSKEIKNIMIKSLLKVREKVQELTDITIPLAIPHIKFKIKSLELSDKLLYFEIMGIKVQKCSEKDACTFFQGYLKGVLETLNIEYDKIEIVEEKREDNEVNCKYIAILKKTIKEILEQLKQEKEKQEHFK